jgi:hypothetical protein
MKKHFKYTGFGFLFLLLLTSCSKSLDLSPEDSISDAQYWTTANDLTLYANQFYTAFPVNSGYFVSPFWTDINSDDMIPGTYDQRLAGRYTVASLNANWSYADIRKVNYGLENYGRIKTTYDQLAAGVGELQFFRAYFYFKLVRFYGDVPWLGQTININSPELYSERTKRNVVVDSILLDLDNAITNLPLKATAAANRLNRECALQFKSRVALFEGTWEKYHANTVFGVAGSDYRKYLEIAVDAAGKLINLKTASLFPAADPANYFRSLFGETNLTGNPEILLHKRNIEALGMGHNIAGALYKGGDRGLSRSLVESFLCKDGLPIAKSPLYKGDDNLNAVVTDRDPRLVQSMWTPGQPFTIKNNVVLEYFTLPWLDKTGELRCTSGYQLAKGRSVRVELGMDDRETATIIFRFAETLLNYAEAKAELGTITQEDLDKSLNLLRRRVKMPDLILANIIADPNWLNPELSPIINEIRRERRVELACEGFRLDDLFRWADAGRLVNKRLLGAVFKKTDFPKLIAGTSIFITTDNYIDPYQKALPTGFLFKIGRDYLLPVPQVEINLNEKLVQNPGW